MPSIYPNIFEAFNNPSMRHAMLVHFPVVLSVVGIVFAVIAALIGEKSRAMRWTALAVYVALVLSALFARFSGQDAEEAVRGSLSEEGREEVEAHEAHGLNLWMWPAGVAVLLGISFARPRAVRMGSAWAAVVGGLLAADQIVHTADHGGRLVYVFGAGAPTDWSALLATGDGTNPSEDPRLAFFRHQVRPILVENCLRCHNPKRAKRSGGLDQTSITGILKGGWSGPAVVPGKPDESLLISAVRWDDPDLQMPAGEEQLADEQIAALEKWVADGAVWEAFEVETAGDE